MVNLPMAWPHGCIEFLPCVCYSFQTVASGQAVMRFLFWCSRPKYRDQLLKRQRAHYLMLLVKARNMMFEIDEIVHRHDSAPGG